MSTSPICCPSAPHPSEPKALVLTAHGEWAYVQLEPSFSVEPVPSLSGFDALVWLNPLHVLGIKQERLVLLYRGLSGGGWVEQETHALQAEGLGLLRVSAASALVEVNTLPWPTIYAYQANQAGQPLRVVDNIHSGLERVVPLEQKQVLYWGGGVQASEVRVAALHGGAWRADTSHQRPVRCIGRAVAGASAVSLDTSGVMLRWSGSPLKARFWCAVAPESLPSERCALLNGFVDLVRKRFWVTAQGSQGVQVWALGPEFSGGSYDAPHLQQVVLFAGHPDQALARDQAGHWQPLNLNQLAQSGVR